MKLIPLYLFMMTLVVLMVLLINKNSEQVVFKYLSVDTYYSYLDREDELIYIDFYLNTRKHPFVEKESYQQLKIHNEDLSKAMNLELKTVIYLNEENYLNETFYKYSYVFSAPELDYDFDIEKCYLQIELTNDDVYDVYIGSISFKSQNEDEPFIEWKALSSKRNKLSFVPRLFEIEIEYIDLNKTIKKISVGNLYETNFIITDHVIKIEITHENQLFYACPVIITYEDEQINTLNYFVYMKDFETLKQSGQLIYHYALN